MINQNQYPCFFLWGISCFKNKPLNVCKKQQPQFKFAAVQTSNGLNELMKTIEGLFVFETDIFHTRFLYSETCL